MTPRMGLRFAHHGTHDYLILIWEPSGARALSIEATWPLCSERQARIRAAFGVLLQELGFRGTERAQPEAAS